MKKVLLAMSGGTDSSVSAMLLKKEGFEVIGIHFSFFDSSWAQVEVMEQQERSIINVQELCKSLNIQYVEVNAAKEFYDTIITYFVSEFYEGRTPFPCAICNPELKWKLLYDKSIELNCDYIATGHYVKVIENNGLHYISPGIDPEKDQSFFLWGLNQEILKKTIFPLGDMKKIEVRDYAERHGFTSVATRKDSLGICFLGNTDYRPFVTKELKKQGITIPQGTHINEKGEILSKNEGYVWYTIGQRKHLGIDLNTRLFVKEVDAKKNSVTLSSYEALYKNTFQIKDFYFHSIEDSKKPLIVKIRYRKQRNTCTLEMIDSKTIKVNLDKYLESIAPGQTAVFYDEDRVVGGGFII